MNYVGFLLANDWFFCFCSLNFDAQKLCRFLALTLSLFFSHLYTFSHYCRCVYLLCSVIIYCGIGVNSKIVCAVCRLVCVRCEYKIFKKKMLKIKLWKLKAHTTSQHRTKRMLSKKSKKNKKISRKIIIKIFLDVSSQVKTKYEKYNRFDVKVFCYFI